MTYVSAWDLGSKTAHSYGWPRNPLKPLSEMYRLDDAGGDYVSKVAFFQSCLNELFRIWINEAKTQPESIWIFYEEPLRIAVIVDMVKSKGGPKYSDDAMGMSRGLLAILCATAHNWGITQIHGVDPQAARRHLLGAGRIPAGEGKQLVFNRCQSLGWNPSSFDESDSQAIWAYGVSRAQPRYAHLSTPLFEQR